MLTSSFPRNSSDETCGYVREFAESLSSFFDVTVLAPDDLSDDLGYRSFRVERSYSSSPPELDESRSAFRASTDLNEVISAGIPARLSLLPGFLLFGLKAIYLAFRSDVICSHWLVPAGAIGAVISKVLGKHHVVVEHSGALHFLRNSAPGRLLARFVVRNSNAVVVVSEDLKAKLLEFCPEAAKKTVAIPMGVDINKIQQPAPVRVLSDQEQAPDFAGKLSMGTHPAGATRTVVFVGRLVRIKGVDVLLRAAALTRKVRVVIAGDGPERLRLEELAAELAVPVEFKGVITANPRSNLYGQADVVVIPSIVLDNGRTEGTPRVCLEAMASGCPVIASRCGGLSDLIVDGQNGLLFDPGHHEMLADKLERLLSNPGLAESLSAEALRTAAQYDWSIAGSIFARTLQSPDANLLLSVRAIPG